jgi:hypothetical protein
MYDRNLKSSFDECDRFLQNNSVDLFKAPSILAGKYWTVVLKSQTVPDMLTYYNELLIKLYLVQMVNVHAFHVFEPHDNRHNNTHQNDL